MPESSVPQVVQRAVQLQRPPCAISPTGPELPSARCGVSDEIIAHVVMDADFLYSSLFPHVNIRHWLGHHAQREVKGFM